MSHANQADQKGLDIAMAWSYLCEFGGMKWGQSVLAVANDNLEVILIL